MVLNILKKRPQTPEEEKSFSRAMDILDQALLQRGKFHIVFDQAVTNLQGVTCSLLSFDASLLVLEATGLRSAKVSFEGSTVTAYFKILEKHPKHREVFYSFTTILERVKIDAAGLVQLHLRTPPALESAQRRKSFRIKPSSRHFQHLAVWRYDHAGGFDLNKPFIAHDHFQRASAAIGDISAGGMRLEIEYPLLKEHRVDLKRGDRFVINIHFTPRDETSFPPFWIIGKISNVQTDPISKDARLGVEFVAFGHPDENTGKVSWRKVEDNIVPDLAHITYAWHLEEYREKGVSDS